MVGNRKRPSLGLDQNGTVFVEYVVVLVTTGVVLAAATASLGIPLSRAYGYASLVLSLPFP